MHVHFPTAFCCVAVVFFMGNYSSSSGQISDEGLDSGNRQPLIIAHRGASGYLPEHSLGAKVLAFAQGADVLEQDVVLSRDRVFVVSHDIVLDKTTDVAERFPQRSREDGHFYYADFDWSELRQLSLREREHRSGSSRFSAQVDQRMLRLEDEIKLVQELNRQFGRQVGLHIELKAPAFHLETFGERMGGRLLPLLAQYGYDSADQLCFIQCFEYPELEYLKRELNYKLPLIQLIGSQPLGISRPTSSKRLSRAELIDSLCSELVALAEVVDGIGPSLELVATRDDQGRLQSSGLVEAAHSANLCVHPYTVRSDALPSWAESVNELQTWLVEELQVEGFFTDFPDLAVKFLAGE